MRRLALLAGLTLGACGSTEPAAIPPACEGSPAAILRALQAAPGNVRLDGGTRISTCVGRALDDVEIQQLGFALIPAARTLASRRTTTAARQLGFLVGAARHGAGRTNNVHAQLLRRLEVTAATVEGRPLVGALRRGIAAGLERG